MGLICLCVWYHLHLVIEHHGAWGVVGWRQTLSKLHGVGMWSGLDRSHCSSHLLCSSWGLRLGCKVICLETATTQRQWIWDFFSGLCLHPLTVYITCTGLNLSQHMLCKQINTSYNVIVHQGVCISEAKCMKDVCHNRAIVNNCKMIYHKCMGIY